MSTIRHPIIREHAIQPFTPINTMDPFRDPMWRDHMVTRDPFFRDAWLSAPAANGHSLSHSHGRDHHWRDGYYRDLSPVPRDYYQGRHYSGEHAGALVPAATPGALPLSRSFFNPERQLSVMDGEMSKMAMEMKRMFSDMQHLMPADADPESWRLKENFLLENPIAHDNDGNRMFRLKFDVRQFRPEEIFVKTMGNELVVHAKHEEKGQDKSLHREYKRLYILPKDLSPENLQSKLTRDGVLSIEAKLPPQDGHGRDRLIPIKHE